MAKVSLKKKLQFWGTGRRKKAIARVRLIPAGSVVTKDIPANVVAVGNPCRVVRPVTEKDREVWDTGENGEGPLSQGPKANSPG